jgi:hypothetical protein
MQLEDLKSASEVELRRFYVAECTKQLLTTRLFIRNVGTIEFEGRVFKSGITGMADVWGWFSPVILRTPFPIPLEIELKNVRTRETKEQRAWAAYCVRRGVPYLKLRAKKKETPRQVVDRWVEETGDWLGELARRP